MLSSMTFLPVVLRRGLSRGFKNIVREEGWGTALGSLLGVLFLGQILLVLIFGVEGGLYLLQQQSDLRLEIQESASDVQIQDLIQTVRQLPYIADVVYITREQAFERQKTRDPQLIKFLTTFGIANPFPETMGVRLRALSDYPVFVQFLRQPLYAKIVNPTFLSTTTDQEQQVFRLIEAVRSSEYILFFIIALVIVAVLFVVVELVRRRALSKREELLVLRLVGAGPMSIFIPFWTEMMCLLCIALALSILCTGLVLWALPLLLPVLGSQGMFGTWSLAVTHLLFSSLVWLIPLEFFSMLLLAVCGTFWALKLHNSFHVLPLSRAQ